MPSGIYERKKSPWKSEVLAFVKESANEDTTIEAVRRATNEHFGLSVEYEQIKAIFYRYRLPFKRNVRHNLLLTDEQAEFMASVIPSRSSDEVAGMMNEMFGLSLAPSQVRGWKKNHKCPSGYDTKYRRGVKPWITGKKFPGHTNAGCWEKGHIAANNLPIGTVRMHGGYWVIKVRDGNRNDNWVTLHRHIWEKEHGPVPDGYKLMFRDMNPDNVTLDNIVLVSAKDVCVASVKFGFTNEPEINDAILSTTKLMRVMKERTEKDED